MPPASKRKTPTNSAQGRPRRRRLLNTVNLAAQGRTIPLARRPLLPNTSIVNNVGPCNVSCGRCGALHFSPEKVKRSAAEGNVFTMCCANGAVQLPAVVEPEPELRELLEDQTPRMGFNILLIHL